MIDLSLLKNEIVFKSVHSSGAGGQHVNKVATKIQLSFSIANSAIFNLEEKAILTAKLGKNISKEGLLLIECSKTRSQLKNKELALLKLVILLQKALTPQKKRIATKVPHSVMKKRLSDKKIISEKKENRKFRY